MVEVAEVGEVVAADEEGEADEAEEGEGLAEEGEDLVEEGEDLAEAMVVDSEEVGVAAVAGGGSLFPKLFLLTISAAAGYVHMPFGKKPVSF